MSKEINELELMILEDWVSEQLKEESYILKRLKNTYSNNSTLMKHVSRRITETTETLEALKKLKQSFNE